ncbi:SIR2 family NAD-dependent protein deacylase [Maribacter sp. 2210JD10-5]|uniref:SIR2 family NAD-dependent protein deacylase n=1 Tax=Maribacter sp. 2210JD10-5 TaxID=3386272 RepID=UPI0039BC452A
MRNIVVLTGAGISAESGLKTFRDSNGLWEGHDVMEVASSQAFQNNPDLVLDFYNQRRRQLLEVSPNAAHKALTMLETLYNVDIITQNVDDLHERAGSNSVMHLHGELFKVRSTGNNSDVFEWKKDILIGDTCKLGHQLRPHIVWFGEAVPLLEKAVEITKRADILIIVGTSMQVYPAASLIDFVTMGTPIYFVDPNPSISKNQRKNLTVIPKTAVDGVPNLVASLIDTKF